MKRRVSQWLDGHFGTLGPAGMGSCLNIARCIDDIERKSLAGFQQGNGESKSIRTETVDRLDIQSQLIASTLSISSRKP